MSKQAGIRFQVRFVNGAWAVFDTVQYRNVTVRGLKKAAEMEANRRNTQ